MSAAAPLPLSDTEKAGCLYTPGPDWTPAMVTAHKDMPTLGGYVLSLFQTPPKQLPGYEAAWRAWCKKYPAELWPVMIHQWSAAKKRSRNEPDALPT